MVGSLKHKLEARALIRFAEALNHLGRCYADKRDKSYCDGRMNVRNE